MSVQLKAAVLCALGRQQRAQQQVELRVFAAWHRAPVGHANTRRRADVLAAEHAGAHPLQEGLDDVVAAKAGHRNRVPARKHSRHRRLKMWQVCCVAYSSVSALASRGNHDAGTHRPCRPEPGQARPRRRCADHKRVCVVSFRQNPFSAGGTEHQGNVHAALRRRQRTQTYSDLACLVGSAIFTSHARCACAPPALERRSKLQVDSTPRIPFAAGGGLAAASTLGGRHRRQKAAAATSVVCGGAAGSQENSVPRARGRAYVVRCTTAPQPALRTHTRAPDTAAHARTATTRGRATVVC